METAGRIEPCFFEDYIPTELADLSVDLQREAGQLGHGLHPDSAAELADFVRVMNCYYSNLIEGHNTRPRDIEKALAGAELAEETRPPSSPCVAAFMDHFDKRFQIAARSASGRIIAIASAHHRLNYIHPFRDGNGRVSRLMSHAMALNAGIGGIGLWSISRGLARGLTDRGEAQFALKTSERTAGNTLKQLTSAGFFNL